jgi:hypothetical protein
MRLPHYMLLVALLPACAAQDAKFASEVKVVALLATVHDSNGAIVKDLTKTIFDWKRMATRKPSAISRASRTFP